MKSLLAFFIMLISLSGLSAVTPEEADTKVKAAIEENRVVVDICIYEQQWISPSNEYPKGRLIKRAIVTEVYKGTDVELGARLEFDENADDFPGKFDDFTSTVEGDLRTLFSIRGPIARGAGNMLIFGGDLPEPDGDGKVIHRANNWIFPRISGAFASSFNKVKQDRSIFSTRLVPPTKTEANP